jgi:hypothetical protein
MKSSSFKELSDEWRQSLAWLHEDYYFKWGWSH